MSNDVIGHIRSEINQRTTNPYFFCFITALALYNYDLILIAFSGTSITYKLALMSSTLSKKTHWSYAAPLLYAAGAYLFIALTSYSKYGWEKVNIWVGNKIINLQDKELILRGKYRLLEYKIDDKEDAISLLKEKNTKLLDDAEDHRKKTIELESHVSDIDFENIKLNERISELLQETEKYKLKLNEYSETTKSYQSKTLELQKIHEEELARNSVGMTRALEILNKTKAYSSLSPSEQSALNTALKGSEWVKDYVNR